MIRRTLLAIAVLLLGGCGATYNLTTSPRTTPMGGVVWDVKLFANALGDSAVGWAAIPGLCLFLPIELPLSLVVDLVTFPYALHVYGVQSEEAERAHEERQRELAVLLGSYRFQCSGVAGTLVLADAPDDGIAGTIDIPGKGHWRIEEAHFWESKVTFLIPGEALGTDARWVYVDASWSRDAGTLDGKTLENEHPLTSHPFDAAKEPR